MVTFGWGRQFCLTITVEYLKLISCLHNIAVILSMSIFLVMRTYTIFRSTILHISMRKKWNACTRTIRNKRPHFTCYPSNNNITVSEHVIIVIQTTKAVFIAHLLPATSRSASNQAGSRHARARADTCRPPAPAFAALDS